MRALEWPFPGADLTGAVQCDCLAGFYRPVRACQQCPPGSYCAGGDAAESCPANTATASGATSAAGCRVLAGFYGAPGAAAAPCPAGSYCPAGAAAALACPANTAGPAQSIDVSVCKVYSYLKRSAESESLQASEGASEFGTAKQPLLRPRERESKL